MNKYIILFLLCLFIIIVLIIVRTVTYNKYISRITSKNIQENFEDSQNHSNAKDLNELKFGPDMPNNIKDQLSNPKIIYSDILGAIYVINESSVFVLNKDKINTVELKQFFNLEKKINIEGGFFNHFNSTINIFESGNVHVYDLKKNKITCTMTKTDFFNLDRNVKNVLVYYHYLVIFTENSKIPLIFNLKINQYEEDSELTNQFSKAPRKFSACFINFLDIETGIPIGTPTFLKDGDIYTFDLKTQEFMGPRRIEYGFMCNTDSIVMKKTNLGFYLKKSANYRVYVFGAGLPNGGYGGLIFNDIYIKKKTPLSVICGTQGERIPVKGKESANKLTNVYSIKLPYNGSCSGSGGTFFFVDDKLKIASGGGGGWSSELVEAPTFCDSERYLVENNGKTNRLPKITLPIKKIIIITQNSRDNIRYKIKVNKWKANIYNLENVDLEVSEIPIISSLNKKNLFETDYCNINETAQIEFTFKEPISDYKILLDYDILSSDSSEYSNSKVIFIDEQYRKYTIDNFNFTFNYKYITGENIMNFINGNNITTSNIDEQPLVTHGFNDDLSNKEINIKNVTMHMDKYFDFSKDETDFRYMTLKGGIGGGGHSISDRKSNNIISAGGGGYQGGKSCNVNEKNGLEYSGGCGGTSFIDEINFSGSFKTTCEDLFVNNANNNNGYIVLQRIDKQIAQKKIDNENSENSESLNEPKDLFNNFQFHNSKVNSFFEQKNRGSNLLYAQDSILNNKSEFDFNEGEINVKKNYYVIPIKRNKNLDQVCLGIKSNNPFNCFLMGWDSKNYDRCLINFDKKTHTDNISFLNHGHNKLNKTKMNKFLEFLIENDIYSYSNSLSQTTIKKMNKNHIKSNQSIKKLSALNDFKLMSVNKNTENSVNGIVNLNYDEMLVIIQFDNDLNNNLKYVYTKYDKMKNSDEDVMERTLLYL